MPRKFNLLLLLIGLCGGLILVRSGGADPYTPEKLPALRLIEDFSGDDVGKFPESFRTYPFQRGKAMRVYTVRSDAENRYLSAVDSEDLSTQVFKRFYWEARRWPYFSWRWRGKVLPKGAAENDPATNDSACGVYVVFGGYTGKVLKYVWSTTLPVGTVFEKKRNKFFIIVKESGPKNLGAWKTVSTNVMEDYRKVFKSDPTRDPNGFGLLTDGNATHSTAACDYDDFKISESKF